MLLKRIFEFRMKEKLVVGNNIHSEKNIKKAEVQYIRTDIYNKKTN